MTDRRTKWMESMMTKYDTDEKGVREIMRERQQKSMLNPNRQKGNHRGGFSYMSSEQLKEVSALGGKSSRKGKRD